MPCNNGGATMYDAYGDSNALRRAEERNDLLAQMLCALIRYSKFKTGNSDTFSGTSFLIMEGIHPQLWKWWKEHEATDAKRVAEEQAEQKMKALRQAALNKLTKAERKLLGI